MGSPPEMGSPLGWRRGMERSVAQTRAMGSPLAGRSARWWPALGMQRLDILPAPLLRGPYRALVDASCAWSAPSRFRRPLDHSRCNTKTPRPLAGALVVAGRAVRDWVNTRDKDRTSAAATPHRRKARR